MSLSENFEEQQSKTLVEGIDKIEDNNVSSDTSSSCSSDSENSNSELSNKNSESIEEPIYKLKMLNLCKDFMLFTLVAVVTYAALINDPPKVTKAPAAYPFFSKESPIIDWYRGHLSNAIEHARSSDIAFVMFYAPWDAESQHARKQFEIAAKHMQNYVTFAAVNCWHPTGECRNKYNKVYGWPVLIVYPAHGRGIQYSGPIIAEYMVKFLLNVCWPFKRLPEPESLLDFQDAYITVDVNTLPGSVDFAVVYSTALKYLEKDPFQSVAFYVNPQAEDTEPLLMLHLWNETLIYPIHDKDWRPETIIQWIFKNLHQPTRWVTPTGTKSVLLANSVYPGPSLILFIPTNPLHYNNDYYNMLQELGEEYYRCENTLKTDFNRFASKRLVNFLQFQQLKRDCSKSEKPINKKDISLVATASFWANNSNSCLSRNKNRVCVDTVKSCENLISFPALEEEDLHNDVYKTSMLRVKNDPKSPENLDKLLKKEQCRLFLIAEGFQPARFEKEVLGYEKNDNSVNITGFACKSNLSLSLIAMDTLNHFHFAEKLGIDLFKNRDKSAAVIINDKMETHYVMDLAVSGKNLRNFIRNFTMDTLERSLGSINSVDSKKTHTYQLGAQCELKKRENREISVVELDSKSFLPTILQKNKAVVVFYYSKQCSFCNGIAFTFLTVAKKLQFVKHLQFTRIDGELNSLPWEFSMESFPTILYFPANRKSDSVAFPTDIPITVPNLVGFLLTNLEANLKLHAMWSICNQTKFEEETSLCTSTIRAETLTIIENTLKQWRIANKRQKQIYLYKLKQLKQLHLLFAHSPKKHQLIQSYFVKLNSEPNFSEDYYNLKEQK